MNRRDFFKLLLFFSATGDIYSCIDIEDKDNDSDIFFPQGVASGDPKENGIVLWTRINPDIFESNYIELEISKDPKFQEIIHRETSLVNEEVNFTVKAYVENDNLKPWNNYYYRFKYKNVYSETGKFKTLPSRNQDIERVRIGVINCQDFSTGYYNAHYHLLTENPDFILFLGDYIYEYSKDKNAKRTVREISLPSGKDLASSEEDYHYLYNTYRSDKYLKELHRNFTFLIIWDDHEYANDCYGFYAPDHFIKDEESLKKLRISANRAWFYNLPVDVPFSDEFYNGIRTYRHFRFGSLFEITLTDERLYRSPHPCGEGTFRNRYLTEGCGTEEEPYMTMLGDEQKDWFFEKIENSDTKWFFWGNPVLFVPLKFEDYYVSLDSWDGFQYERSQILQKVKNEKEKGSLKNFITLTGDIHSFVAGYAELDGEVVFPEFATISATSSNIDELIPFNLDVKLIEKTIKMSNKHIKYFNSHSNGYTIVDIYPDFVEVTFKKVTTVLDKKSELKTEKIFRIYSGEDKFVEI